MVGYAFIQDHKCFTINLDSYEFLLQAHFVIRCLRFVKCSSFRKSLDLVETLLRLSEHGHYQNISELFKFPVMNCPDMLVLALLQIVSLSIY